MSSNWQHQALGSVVRTLLFGAVLSRLALSMTIPFLTIYLVQQTSMSITTVGLVVGGASVAGMFGGFVAGALTDRYGRNAIMLTSLYIWVAVFILFALVHSAVLLAILTWVNGTCRSVYEPVSQVLLSDSTHLEERYRIFSLRYTAANIGYSAGPLIGAWFGLTGGTGGFWFTACTFLVYTVCLQIVLRTQHRDPLQMETGITASPSFRSITGVVFRDRTLLYFLVGGMLVRSAYEQVNSNLSIHFQAHVTHGLQLFALTLSVNAITVVVCQTPISRWAQRISLFRNIALGNVCYAAGFVGYAFTTTWTVGILATVLFTLGEILSFPAGTLFIDSIAPEDMRGAYYGTKNIMDLGKFIGPWIGGLVMSAWGGTRMLCLMAFVVLASTVFYRIGSARHRTARDLHTVTSS